MSEKRRGPATRRSTPPAQHRRHGGRGGLALEPGSATTPRMPPPPAPARLGRATPPPIVRWPHLLVNGLMGTFYFFRINGDILLFPVSASTMFHRPKKVQCPHFLRAATKAGRAAVAATTPLIAAAHNVAFRPLDGRAFERLGKIARALDTASTVAVGILARRTGEELDTSIRELRRTARRLGAKWD